LKRRKKKGRNEGRKKNFFDSVMNSLIDGGEDVDWCKDELAFELKKRKNKGRRLFSFFGSLMNRIFGDQEIH